MNAKMTYLIYICIYIVGSFVLLTSSGVTLKGNGLHAYLIKCKRNLKLSALKLSFK